MDDAIMFSNEEGDEHEPDLDDLDRICFYGFRRKNTLFLDFWYTNLSRDQKQQTNTQMSTATQMPTDTQMPTETQVELEQPKPSTIVHLNTFLFNHPLRGNMRLDLVNLSKAGMVQVGNVLCQYDKPDEEDIVECLRNAGLPPSAYPSVDIFDPSYHNFNSIKLGKFNINIERKTVQVNALGFPMLTVDFLINETNTIAPVIIGGDGGEEDQQEIANNTVTRTRLVKKITAKFNVRTLFFIRRLQMYAKRCNFNSRCYRRKLLLQTTCLLAKEASRPTDPGDEGKYTLASLFNDPRGGIFGDCVAKWILASAK